MSHNHCADESCCGKKDNCCQKESCCCHENQKCCHENQKCCDKKEGECKHGDKLLCLADQAWMEVLKEKIKQEILKNSGEHLDELAKLVSDYNCKIWHEKIALKKDKCEFEEHLRHMMCSSKGSCSR